VNYAYAGGVNLIGGKPVPEAAELTLSPWDLMIVEESAAATSARSTQN
jgi:hypothetical protein